MTHLIVEIGEGCEFPSGYGLAWRRWDRNKSVCMPVPLNIVCGLAVRVYRWMQSCMRTPTAAEKRDLRAFMNGRAEGYKSGYESGYKGGRIFGQQQALDELLSQAEIRMQHVREQVRIADSKADSAASSFRSAFPI